jgi:aspartate--ammonia ligase
MSNETLELSSMGIRVNKDTLMEQLKELGKEKWKNLYFHKRLLSGELPPAIGGGIGQSRLFMLLLRKKAVAEVLPTVWNEESLQEFKNQNIPVL